MTPDRPGAALNDEARLVLDGHTITDVELFTIYHLDVVAVVAARLYPTGPRALLSVDEGLSTPVRDATMTVARRAIANFATTHLGASPRTAGTTAGTAPSGSSSTNPERRQFVNGEPQILHARPPGSSRPTWNGRLDAHIRVARCR